MRVVRGIVVWGGMLVLGAALLIVLSIGAMVALSIGLLLMPGLMVLVWVLVRRRRGYSHVTSRGGARLRRVR